MQSPTKKGFTLIELLVVIGILVVLAAVLIVVLDPTELLKQARDSQRMNDLGALKSAIAFYLVNVASPVFGAGPFSTANIACAFGAACTVNATTTLGGAGWVPIDFTTGLTAVGLRPPISALPMDPNNDAATACLDASGGGTIRCQYAYKGVAANLTFKLAAGLESKKFTTAPKDARANDGGTLPIYYEVGNDMSL